MFIKTNQIREGGTKIKLGDIEYHFAPNKDGDHVCEVLEKSHIDRLLSIDEAFKEHGKPAPQKAPNSDSISDSSNQQSTDAKSIDQIDVSTMKKPELLELAKLHGIKVNANAPVPALRKQIAAAIEA